MRGRGLGLPGRMLDSGNRGELSVKVGDEVYYGKYAGTVGAPSTLAGLVDMGYSFIGMGADVIAIGDYCRGLLTECRGTLKERA